MSNKRVVTGECRFSYAHVWEPWAGEDGGEPKYSVSILISKKDKKTVEKIEAAIAEATKEGIAGKWGGKKPSKFWNPLRDGDEEVDDKGEEYAKHFFVSAKSKKQPGILDENKEEIIDKKEFYSGCYGKAIIEFFPFDAAGSKGVGVGLVALQKTRDGENLGGGGFTADEFDEDDL